MKVLHERLNMFFIISVCDSISDCFNRGMVFSRRFMAIFTLSTPVAIMAGSLEVGKLVTLHGYTETGRGHALLKSYLTFATIVLMFITSLGIFDPSSAYQNRHQKANNHKRRLNVLQMISFVQKI